MGTFTKTSRSVIVSTFLTFALIMPVRAASNDLKSSTKFKASSKETLLVFSLDAEYDAVFAMMLGYLPDKDIYRVSDTEAFQKFQTEKDGVSFYAQKVESGIVAIAEVMLAQKQSPPLPLSFCRGANNIAFELVEGTVSYLGHFNIAGEQLNHAGWAHTDQLNRALNAFKRISVDPTPLTDWKEVQFEQMGAIMDFSGQPVGECLSASKQ